MRTLEIPADTRIASSHPEERVDDYRFAETLLVNRRFVTKIFDELAAAKKWLLEETCPAQLLLKQIRQRIPQQATSSYAA